MPSIQRHKSFSTRTFRPNLSGRPNPESGLHERRDMLLGECTMPVPARESASISEPSLQISKVPYPLRIFAHLEKGHNAVFVRHFGKHVFYMVFSRLTMSGDN